MSDAARAATVVVEVDGDYVGPAMVAGYTVAYERGVPFQAIAIVDTPTGLRSIAQSTDPTIVAAFTENEWVGTTIEVASAEIKA